MAGLLAARVLADHFEQVTLIERDALTDTAQPRKGVPQGQQLHVLCAAISRSPTPPCGSWLPALACNDCGAPQSYASAPDASRRGAGSIAAK
jgi:hypothetical protein